MPDFLISGWTYIWRFWREEKEGSWGAKRPGEKVKMFHTAEDKAPEKQVCPKDASRTGRKPIHGKARCYHEAYRQVHRTETQMAWMTKKSGNFYVRAEPKLALVIWIRDINGVSPKVCKVLQLLYFCQIFNGTFVRFNKASVNMMRNVGPYSAWRYQNMKLVNELIC